MGLFWESGYSPQELPDKWVCNDIETINKNELRQVHINLNLVRVATSLKRMEMLVGTAVGLYAGSFFL